jgi:hypothetical protein
MYSLLAGNAGLANAADNQNPRMFLDGSLVRCNGLAGDKAALFKPSAVRLISLIVSLRGTTVKHDNGRDMGRNSEFKQNKTKNIIENN